MYLFGFDVTEWAALISVISGVVIALFWGFKKLVTDPANENSRITSEQIKELHEAIHELSASLNSTNAATQKHLEDHDVKLATQDTKIANQNERIINLERAKNLEED